VLSRRGFLKRFGIGLGAALVLAKLPEAAVQALTQTEAAKRCAIEYMRQCYNAHVREQMASRAPGQRFYMPNHMHVSPGLYAAYEGELTVCQRYESSDLRDGPWDTGLLFKGTRVTADPKLTKWEVRFNG
jgi:hypothetical protein